MRILYNFDLIAFSSMLVLSIFQQSHSHDTQSHSPQFRPKNQLPMPKVANFKGGGWWWHKSRRRISKEIGLMSSMMRLYTSCLNGTSYDWTSSTCLRLNFFRSQTPSCLLPSVDGERVQLCKIWKLYIHAFFLLQSFISIVGCSKTWTFPSNLFHLCFFKRCLGIFCII